MIYLASKIMRKGSQKKNGLFLKIIILPNTKEADPTDYLLKNIILNGM